MERITNKLKVWVELHELIGGEAKKGKTTYTSTWTEGQFRPVDNSDTFGILTTKRESFFTYEDLTADQIKKYIKQIKGGK